jgi:hypothetical protein
VINDAIAMILRDAGAILIIAGVFISALALLIHRI